MAKEKFGIAVEEDIVQDALVTYIVDGERSCDS